MSKFPAWVIEPAHTHIGFSVSHLGLTRTPGVFKRFRAQLQFDDKNIEASSVIFEVETASIDTALEMRDEHLREPDWLSVEAHPRAVFHSRSLRRKDDGTYLLEGDFTLRGQTRTIMFDTVFTGKAVNPWTRDSVVGFEAVAVLSRSDYGMTLFPGAVGDEIRLEIGIELTRPGKAG